MKKAVKIIAYTAMVLVVLVISAVTYITTALPNVGEPENIKVAITPARVERGKYLATHVAVCVDCHSPHDWTKLGGPMDTTQLGAGGEKFDAGVGFPGNVVVPNITPYNLKNWTDGEMIRAITTGVKKDGSAIFPLMPWKGYSKMDKEDIYAIVAYIRTLKPVAVTHPKASLDFPLNILVHTMPQKAQPGNLPDPKDSVKYGEYIVSSAGCMDCHSQDNQGEYLPGLEFAGGKPFKVGAATVHSANITPDAATGIGKWTKEQFVARFKAYANQANAHTVEPGEFQTIMPWWNYGGMTDTDLGAVYVYLHTLKPVNNKVTKFIINSYDGPDVNSSK